MSEYIRTTSEKAKQLKSLFRELHKGKNVEEIREKIIETMVSIPYKDVVMAEEELMNEGIAPEEILSFCDLHTDALKGSVDLSDLKEVQHEHPVYIFKLENRAIEKVIEDVKINLENIKQFDDDLVINSLYSGISKGLEKLFEIEKHYVKKENLLFPFLEKYDITAPPKVMWGKHDQIRGMLKQIREILSTDGDYTAGDVKILTDTFFLPAITAIEEMIYKEENILFPMALDILAEKDWNTINSDAEDIGYCLIPPPKISNISDSEKRLSPGLLDNRINLPSGNFNLLELTSLMNTLPFDITFVDKDDSVRFFTQGKERIFERNISIIGRKVQMCHPPSSVHIVEKILNDFKSGKEDEAKFWIQMKGQFILISYFALRSEEGEYLGTLEVTQDITAIKKLEGERRILEYETKERERINV